MNTTTDVKKWLENEEETVMEILQRLRWVIKHLENHPRANQKDKNAAMICYRHITEAIEYRNGINLKKSK